MPSSIFNSNSSILFPIRVGFATLAIIIAYGLFIGLVRPGAVISYNSGLRNRIIAEQYVDTPGETAVLVGSSLGVRLTSEVTDGLAFGPDIFNLAMLGQNSATGLDIVLRREQKPKLALVEMNILEHPYDPQFAEQLFDEPWRFLRRAFPLFRLENRPFDLVVIALEKTAKFVLNKAGLHSVEPVYSPRSDELQSGHTSPAGAVDEAFMNNVRIALDRLGDQIDVLQSQNIKVILLRFPVDSSFDATPREGYKREMAYRRLPREKYHWYDLQETGTYQTLDGLHLTGASARQLMAIIRKIVDAKGEVKLNSSN